VPSRRHAVALSRRHASLARCVPQGVRGNLEVALSYMEAWLRGVGAIPFHVRGD
jgi:malate synthase